MSATTVMTARLLLRPFQAEDYAALRRIVADPEVFRYRSRRSISEDETRAFLARLLRAQQETPPSTYAFALVLRASGDLIGECGLTRIADEPGTAFLWYTLQRAYWGQGLMREGAQAAVDAVFSSTDLVRIVAGCHPDNHASLGVLRAVGLRHDPARLGPDGGPAHEPFALERAAWEAARCSNTT